MMVENEVELLPERWRQLLERPVGGPTVPTNYAFWTMAMPVQYERPRYYEFIRSSYDKRELEPPVRYVDGYHPLIAGSNVFNYFIQDHLIKEARYVVVDISVVRHNSLFEAGFGLGIGAQVRFYFDEHNPIRGRYSTEEGTFGTSEEARRHLPSEVRDSEVANVPIPICEESGLISRSRRQQREFKAFLRDYVRSPLATRPWRRQCPRIHFEDRPCEFQGDLSHLIGQRYFYQRCQTNHRDQADFIRQYLQSRGMVDVETVEPEPVAEGPPLCRTCFCLQLAERVIVDATAPREYQVSAGECAFTLGMVVGFCRTRAEKQVLVHYQEPSGAFGMFAGRRAGWWWERWRDNLGEQLDGWF